MAALPGISVEKAAILIVDDRPANLMSLESVLAELGQTIVAARSGEEALRCLLERDFAVILLDVDMAGMDGFETVAHIRDREKTARTPIILLTACAEATHSAKGYALGAVDCIVTPIAPEILRTKVQVFVQLDLMTREAERLQAQRTTRQAIEALPNPVFFIGANGKYSAVNQAWETFFGLSRAAVIGKPMHEIFADDKANANASEAIDRALLLEPGTHKHEMQIRAGDGSLHDVVYHRATYTAAEGERGIITTIVDITDRKQAEQRQAMEHAITQVLAESSGVAEAMPKVLEMICTSLGWDHGARWQWDGRSGLITRRESFSIDMPGIREFDAGFAEHAFEPDPDGAGLMRRAFASGKPVWIADISKEAGFKRRDRARKAGLHGAFAIPLVRRGTVLGVMEFFHRDIREPDAELLKIAASIGSEVCQYIVRTEAEEAVKFMAMHDGLTGLPNRAMFNERLAGAIAQARRHSRALAVLFVDLDRFKLINDTLGHEAGDALLREAAYRLTENLRGGDTVARLGGDEFVVLLEQVVDPLYVGAVSHKLIEALAAPFDLGGREYCVTASIGVSAFPEDGTDPDMLLKSADLAMYRAKQKGKNCFEFYSAQVTLGSMERLNLEVGLRRALERGDELTLHYQPQIEACTGGIVGMEALVRWQHPELGLLEPSRFIKLAEETGLIVPLGEWVLHAACKGHREWQRLRLAPARIAVNLSPRQFLHAGLLNDTLRTLKDTACAAKYIELEITESMVMHDPAGAVGLIQELKELGVRVAMDDFGTGYSSLAYLKRFPIDSLKVDRSFVMDVPTDAGNVAITGAIIAMARTLHLTVIAEGVETAAQFHFLRSRGCDEVQGYYFSPPVDFHAATALLREQSVDRRAAHARSTATTPI